MWALIVLTHYYLIGYTEDTGYQVWRDPGNLDINSLIMVTYACTKEEEWKKKVGGILLQTQEWLTVGL